MSSFEFKIVAWLILPVVICLSQRLSHACLSINNFVLWNCEWLIKSVIVYLIIPYYLDNRGNSRANTCYNTRLQEGWYWLDTKPTRATGLLVIHSHFSNRMTLRRRWFIQISALSTFDGRIEAYHGLTGNGELGFDSGEGAWETATTSKEGSRRANYPILTQGGSDNK